MIRIMVIVRISISMLIAITRMVKLITSNDEDNKKQKDNHTVMVEGYNGNTCNADIMKMIMIAMMTIIIMITLAMVSLLSIILLLVIIMIIIILMKFVTLNNDK